jgi:HD-GYP domain-containing protein (c-di-GMP phosphodiesterase class II)
MATINLNRLTQARHGTGASGLLTQLGTLLIPVALLFAGTYIVHAAGGTRSAYPHVMYIPILVAAYVYQVPGGLLAAVAAGLALGPFMPIDVELDVAQPTAGWVTRLAFFTLIGLTAGVLIHNLRKRNDAIRSTSRELSRGWGKSLRTFAHVVALRDEQTAGHCERVASNAVCVGRELGLDNERLENLHWAGILHDLGKIATPTSILQKKGNLTPKEFAEIQKHPDVGADLLLQMTPRFHMIAVGVRAHHEKWDGTGYPNGLKGDGIPMFSRILSVVDVFEALTSDRPYRSALSPQEALAYLKENAGTHFDPDLITVFVKLYEDNQIGVAGDETYVTSVHPPEGLVQLYA